MRPRSYLSAFRLLAVFSVLLELADVRTHAAVPVSLAGTWRFQLDPADVGGQERWYEKPLGQRIRLPGALQNQGFGDDITVDTKWTGEVGTDRWKRGDQYAKYRQPGNIKVPFFLQPEKHYVGAAWYQRDIEIRKDWQGKRIVLTLERPHWGTEVWLDGQSVGTNISLSTPHVYELGVDLKPGRHTLTIRVDNRILVEVGDWSHSVSDHTQGNWNGVVGRIELSTKPALWIDDQTVFPAGTDSVRVQVMLQNTFGTPVSGSIALRIREKATGKAVGNLRKEFDIPTGLRLDQGQSRHIFYPHFPLEITVRLEQPPALWSEFSPILYEVESRVVTRDRDVSDVATTAFGLRRISAQGQEFLLNGRPIFFRGTLECCIFPKTGYPPTDVDSWKRIIRICKAHGLNHIRFHSWCPPEAAFVAADELGFYYQVECGVWTQPGNGKAIDQWLYDESERIVRAYGNHPSFMLLTHGNEPHGPKREEYLAKWVNHWKRDGRFLVTSGSAYPQLPENQYHVHYPCRGPHGWLGKDYRKDVEKLDVPAIVHEMGQWCVYPNFDEIRKYSGPLKAKNFEIFRDSLAEHGMLDQGKDFLRASGRLQVLCYKEEIEAALRTPGIGGFQLLDLHDFPGQGTALVGVLDPFWDGKGYVTPREFSRFCGPLVPLARLLKRTWTTGETLVCDVECANFCATLLEGITAKWALEAEDGRAVAYEQFSRKTLPLGPGIPLGQVSLDLAKVSAPGAYRLVVTIQSKDGRSIAENDWTVWVYPAAPTRAPDPGVLVTSALDAAALARLDAGGKVLLFPGKLSGEHPKLTFEPVFWNRYMFNTQNRQTLGLLCDSRHPALAQFPTDGFQDWQWRDIVGAARGMVLEDLPTKLRPIVQPIDDWNTNRKLGLLFECRVGQGRLLVCSADLDKDLDQRPAARQLRQSLVAYAGSDRFKPRVDVSKEDLARMLERNKPSKLVRLGAKVLSVDSEDTANGNVAANAIDGDSETIWHTRWQPRNDPMPHELVIDLGREVPLKGVTYLPRQEQVNGRIAEAEIFCGNDPKSWGPPTAAVKWVNGSQPQVVKFNGAVTARYLRLVVKSEVNGNPFASVSELDVVMDGQ